MGEHERCWARHQTITDPAHATAPARMRANHRVGTTTSVATGPMVWVGDDLALREDLNAVMGDRVCSDRMQLSLICVISTLVPAGFVLFAFDVVWLGVLCFIGSVASYAAIREVKPQGFEAHLRRNATKSLADWRIRQLSTDIGLPRTGLIVTRWTIFLVAAATIAVRLMVQ